MNFNHGIDIEVHFKWVEQFEMQKCINMILASQTGEEDSLHVAFPANSRRWCKTSLRNCHLHWAPTWNGWSPRSRRHPLSTFTSFQQLLWPHHHSHMWPHPAPMLGTLTASTWTGDILTPQQTERRWANGPPVLMYCCCTTLKSPKLLLCMLANIYQSWSGLKARETCDWQVPPITTLTIPHKTSIIGAGCGG